MFVDKYSPLSGVSSGGYMCHMFLIVAKTKIQPCVFCLLFSFGGISTKLKYLLTNINQQTRVERRRSETDAKP